VKHVIKEWEKHANIRFNFISSQNATIRITFDTNGGSWSYVGQDILSAKPLHPTMNLSWIDDSEDISKTDKGVILHEFGHTLGLGHEQNVESIMMYVLYIYNNVDNANKAYFAPFIGISCQHQ
jgi:hypothetical protein